MNRQETHYERSMRYYIDKLPKARRVIAAKGLANGFQAYSDLINDAILGRQQLTDLYWPGALVHAACELVHHLILDPYDYAAFATHPRIERFFSLVGAQAALMMHGAPEATSFPKTRDEMVQQLRTEISQRWQILNHERGGKRVFAIDIGLAERLDKTELRGLRGGDVRLPYRAVYFCIPPELRFEVWNQQTGRHTADGVYIVEDTSLEDHLIWHVMICGPSNNEDETDDALFYAGLPMKIGEPIEQVVLTLADKMTTAEPHMREPWLRTINWIVNAVIYATSADARIEHATLNREARQLEGRIANLPKNSKQREKLRERLKGLDPMRRIVLGAGTPRLSEEPVNARGPLTVRTLVSGFWRHQPFGPARSLRRLQWISPFWRGPDLAAETPGIHRLK
jgi:hypothetical protein